MLFSTNSFSSQFLNFKKLFIYHMGVLTYFLDPVISPKTAPYQQLEPKWQNAHFLFPVFYIVVIYVLFGNLPVFLSQVSFSNESVSRPDSSQLAYFPAGVFPLEMWPQSEVLVLLAYGTAAAVLVTFVGGAAAAFNAAGRYEISAGGNYHQQRLTINGKSRHIANGNI